MYGPNYYGDPYTTTWFSDEVFAEINGVITGFKVWHKPNYFAG